MAKYLEDDNTVSSKYRLVDILDENGTSSNRVKQDILGGSNFKWTDKSLEIDESMQKLYDANGQEVSGMALYKYFDDNGNYTGGLYSSEQARAVDEVFANNTSSSYTNIENYWTAQGKPSPATIGKYIAQSSQEVAAALSFSLHVGAQSERTNKITASIDTLTSAGIGISQIASWNIGIVDETGNNAMDAIDVVEKAIQRISQQRSLLGAVQNRLEHTIATLDNVVENTTSAESAIRDTDMAEEMVKNANANILMQAGQSMLAQANQS
ncbi:MAG: flagellin, partial [Lachnospiraceae bacterium]|nr:flagellin [Lachnospiraceae bacterium]